MGLQLDCQMGMGRNLRPSVCRGLDFPHGEASAAPPDRHLRPRFRRCRREGGRRPDGPAQGRSDADRLLHGKRERLGGARRERTCGRRTRSRVETGAGRFPDPPPGGSGSRRTVPRLRRPRGDAGKPAENRASGGGCRGFHHGSFASLPSDRPGAFPQIRSGAPVVRRIALPGPVRRMDLCGGGVHRCGHAQRIRSLCPVVDRADAEAPGVGQPGLPHRIQLRLRPAGIASLQLGQHRPGPAFPRTGLPPLYRADGRESAVHRFRLLHLFRPAGDDAQPARGGELQLRAGGRDGPPL